MIRTFLLIAAALFFGTGILYSQSPLPIGQSQLNFGVGLSEWGIPFYFGIDHSVHKDITIGGEVSYRAYNEKWKNNGYRHRVLGCSGNGNYHFNSVLGIPRKWDFYAGINLGFYIVSSPEFYAGNRTSGIGLGAQIGGRYYWSDKAGINLEFGGGSAFSNGKIGITVKL